MANWATIEAVLHIQLDKSDAGFEEQPLYSVAKFVRLEQVTLDYNKNQPEGLQGKEKKGSTA